jgi:hypothetical protein
MAQSRLPVRSVFKQQCPECINSIVGKEKRARSPLEAEASISRKAMCTTEHTKASSKATETSSLVKANAKRMFIRVKLALGACHSSNSDVVWLIERRHLCAKEGVTYLRAALRSKTVRSWARRCLECTQEEKFSEFRNEPPKGIILCLSDLRPIPVELMEACVVDRRASNSGRRKLPVQE